MGVQKVKVRKDDLSYSHCGSWSDFLENFMDQDSNNSSDNNNSATHDNSCSNCFQTFSSDDKNAKHLAEFDNRLFCSSCLRIYISSHYRRKLLRDVAFDLRSIKTSDQTTSSSPASSSKPTSNQQQLTSTSSTAAPPPNITSNNPITQQSSQLSSSSAASKHQSLTLDCLTFDLSSPCPAIPSSVSSNSPGSESNSESKRPKSCSDTIMDAAQIAQNSPNQLMENLKNGQFCKTCELVVQSSNPENAGSTPAHNCIQALKENLASAQKSLETFKLRSKEQLKAFLHRENNLINYMVGLQADLLVQNHKYKSTIDKLEKQNMALLEKMSQQQHKAMQKVRFPDGVGPNCSSSRFQVVLHRDPNGGSLGFNVAGGVNKSHQEESGHDDSSDCDGKFPILRGLLVTRVSPDSIASRADIQAGDVIVSVNSTSLEKMSHSECIDVIRKSKSPLLLEVERPLEPTVVSSATQTLASDTLFNNIGQVNSCDLISLSSSVTDLDSVGLGSVDHDAVDYILSHCLQQNAHHSIQEVMLFKKSPDEDLGITTEDSKEGFPIIKQVKSLSDCVKSSKNVTQHMTTNSNLDSSKDMATSHRGGSTLLLCGDRVIKVNGVNVESSQHFHQLITQSKSSRLSILVQRDNELVNDASKPSKESSSSKLTTLTCDVKELSGQKSVHVNENSEPKADSTKTTDADSPKQSTDSEHHVDNDVFVTSQNAPRGQKVTSIATKRDEVLRRSNVSENGPKDKSVRKIRIKSEDGQIAGNEMKRYNSLKRDSDANQFPVYQNTFQAKQPSTGKPAHYHAKSHTMKHASSRCNYELLRSSIAAEKPYEMKNSHSMTLNGKHLKKRRDSVELHDYTLKNRDPSEEYDSEMELLLPKSRLNRTERSRPKPNSRSRSIGSQNIYAQIDDATSDEDIPSANQNAPKYSARYERKKFVNEPTTSVDASRQKRRVKKTLSPPLESVLEDKVLTLSKKQQSKLKARMIDGFATVTELMTHGVSSNPLVSVTTL